MLPILSKLKTIITSIVIICYVLIQPTFAAVQLSADFEDGTFDSLTGSNTWEGPTGSYFGNGVYWNHQIVSSPAVGDYSAEITIGSGMSTAAYLFTYVPGASLTGYGIYSADYYIPEGVQPSTWWNIWQWKSSDITYDKPVIDLNLLNIGGTLQLRMTHNPGGVSSSTPAYYSQDIPIEFPTNTWVNIKGEYKATSDSTGQVTIYQDDVEIFFLNNIVTMPGDEIMFWSVNSYADSIVPNPTIIYIDNMSVEDVQGFSEPDPITDPDPVDPDPLDPDPEIIDPDPLETDPETESDIEEEIETNTLPQTSLLSKSSSTFLFGFLLVILGTLTYYSNSIKYRYRKNIIQGKFEDRTIKRIQK